MDRALKVVVVDAVQHDVVLAGTHAGRAERGLPSRVDHHRPSGQQGEIEIAATVEREVHNLLVADHLALGRLDGGQQRRISHYRNAFSELADFERNVHNGRFTDLEVDAAANGAFEPVCLDDDFVVAQRQVRRFVLPIRPGLGL